MGFGIASGFSAIRCNEPIEPENCLAHPGVQDHETVTELSWRFDLRKSALFIQPDCNTSFGPAAQVISGTRWCSARSSASTSDIRQTFSGVFPRARQQVLELS
jgi:hypothetical protein